MHAPDDRDETTEQESAGQDRAAPENVEKAESRAIHIDIDLAQLRADLATE